MGLIPIMAILARLCGASWTPKRYPAEIVWAAAVAILAQPATIAHMLIFTAWGYAAMQLGHGRFYGMNGANLNDPVPEDIESYIQKLYKGDIAKPLYSWLCMGAKGFLVALPLGAWPAIANSLLWPFSYWLGMKVVKNGAYAEILAGAFLGSLAWLSL